MQDVNAYPPVVVLLGPTAVGKSRLALELAPATNAEIVTADSRQVYRYMDIGTAKPSREVQARVPHYMIDLVSPDEQYSAQRFAAEGGAVLRRLAAAGRVALVAGGTGFYVRALLDGLTLPQVEPNAGLRERLRMEEAHHGPGYLHARLGELDPVSAGRIHPHNTPRVIRALEIVETIGGPVPATGMRHGIPALYLGLMMDRETLRNRADARVLEQVEAGLVEETRLLLSMGYSPDSPGLQGFGYRQMAAYLAGQLSLKEAVRAYQAATRVYIRRQMTWFRADDRIQWVESGMGDVDRACSLVFEWLSTVV